MFYFNVTLLVWCKVMKQMVQYAMNLLLALNLNVRLLLKNRCTIKFYVLILQRIYFVNGDSFTMLESLAHMKAISLLIPVTLLSPF